MFSRPWQSTVPAVLDALVARLLVVTAGTAVTIHDGPWIEGGTDPQVIVIGFTGFFSGYMRPMAATSEEFGTAAVTVSGMPDGLGAGIRETYTINCASVVRNGDPKAVSSSRKLAYANAAIVGQILVEPPRWITGISMRATMAAGHSLDYAQDRRGLLVFLPFTIECEAFAQQ